jgi:hypothetical protein
MKNIIKEFDKLFVKMLDQEDKLSDWKNFRNLLIKRIKEKNNENIPK